MGVQKQSRFFGVLICALLAVPAMAEEFQAISQENPGSLEVVVERAQPRENYGKRRDPFRPIMKPRSISSSSRKSLPDPRKVLSIPSVTDPKWKLLGIIHGQYGHQAVIQISSGERVFARPGLELARSGWIIKTISKGEVLLEHQSTTSAETNHPQHRTFILSFQTPGKS